MTAEFKVVIPARYASTRLPGKPLAELNGVPMIVRVARQAERSGATEVVVATDDARVHDAVTAAGHQARMTRDDHASGSDRVMEVAELAGWPSDTLVVNVQGDEPLIPPEVIAQVAQVLADDVGVEVATLCEPITDLADVFDPNVVKVITDTRGFARYFSRAPVPYAREVFAAVVSTGPVPEQGAWFRHIGLYGYRLGALERFVRLPVGRLERIEALEQLRLVEQGIGIRVAAAVVPVPGGVDTDADLERVREALGRGD